jgi:glucosamine--fructose-6-phosphate aminotransferase (isomerizing)
LIAVTLESFARKSWTHAVVLADSYMAGLAEEGALAFKEICQLNSNHYHMLDLRHGPMVKINKDTLAVAFISKGDKRLQCDLLNDIRKKGALILALDCSNTGVISAADLTISMPAALCNRTAAMYMLYCIQLIAYYKAIESDINPDQPNGLDPWIKLS